MNKLKILVPVMALVLMGQGCLDLWFPPPQPPADSFPSDSVSDSNLSDDDRAFSVEPNPVIKIHPIGQNPCPDPFPPTTVLFPEGVIRYEVGDTPVWLVVTNPEGPIQDEGVVLNMEFTCRINDYTSHREEGRVQIRGLDVNDAPIIDSFFDVYMDIEAGQ